MKYLKKLLFILIIVAIWSGPAWAYNVYTVDDDTLVAGNGITLSSTLPAPLKLPRARVAHSATLLADGTLLLVGGWANPSDLYNLTTGSWSQVATDFSVRGHSATLLANGKVLVAGGEDTGGAHITATKLYDPATKRWSNAAPMKVGRTNHTATLLANGKVLVAGGEKGQDYLKSVEVYDPASDTWADGPELPTARAFAAAILLPASGKVLVVGGHDKSQILSSALLYNPATNSWTPTLSPMTTARLKPAISWIGDNVLILGGQGLTSSERYYPPNDRFYSDSQAAMKAERNFGVATTLPNGKTLVSGGMNSKVLDSVELFAGFNSNVTDQYNAQSTPTYSTAAPRTDSTNGAKFLLGGSVWHNNWVQVTNPYDLSMRANPITSLLEDATWEPTGWTGGYCRVPASGSTDTVNLTQNDCASGITWTYSKRYHNLPIVTIDNTLPGWVKTAFQAAGTGYSVQDLGSGGATIVLPEKISRVDATSKSEELWVLDKSAITLPAGATITYDSSSGTYRIRQKDRTVVNTYTIKYNQLTVSLQGIIALDGSDDLALLKKLQGLPGFAPRPAANNSDGQGSPNLNDMHLTAPNEIYAADDEGNKNTIRYVLSGWKGTGSIAENGLPDPGLTTTIHPTITSASTLIWIYTKQIRVTVQTSGEEEPLKVKELPGDTTAGSTTIENIQVSWEETVVENGEDTISQRSLVPGMLVWGYGIEAGTTVEAVDESSETVTLSKAAKFSLTQAAGQYLTFSTQPVYERPGDTVSGDQVVTNIETAGLLADTSVSGQGIEEGTNIDFVDSESQLTLDTIAGETRTGSAGQRLAFGSADPRECQSISDFSRANCAAQSAINFYSVDTVVKPSLVKSQVGVVTLTAKQQFVETIPDDNGNPMLKTRSLTELDYPVSGVALYVNGALESGGRRVLMATNLYKPMTVTWRYNDTRNFIVGQPILPPAARSDIDLDKPPKIQLPALSTDTVDTAFVLAWDNATTSYSRSGDTTLGSAVVENLDSTGLSAGMYVTGPGIPARTTIKSVDSESQVTLSSPATTSATAVGLIIESRQGNRYFPVHPVASFTIKWPIKNSTTTFAESASSSWPAETAIQRHIQGAAANLQPPGAVKTYHSLSSYPAGSTNAVMQGVFDPDRPGMYTIRFNTPKKVPALKQGTAFIVVRAMEFKPEEYDDNDCEVGRAITPEYPFEVTHSDPENKNGFVYYPQAMYDGAGLDKAKDAYDRGSRSGAIIPVNESPAAADNPLIVVWYTQGQGGIGWPTTPVRYKPIWPESATPLEIGPYGKQFDTNARPQAMVYNQPLADKAGFNPNEEHALLTGDRIYALRDDLNGVANHSKPYVLLKYFDIALQQWAMDVYQVTRPETFSYPVEVGEHLAPPFPGAIDQSPTSRLKADGQGAEWYLRDQKGGHWAKAANWKVGDGTAEEAKSHFVMQWYYPMSPDFFWPEQGAGPMPAIGDPVPFLNNGIINESDATTRNFQAGDAPIDVTYVTKWPATASILAVGDTLTTARDTVGDRLPDLYNAMSAEVVFDESVYTGQGPLAKLYAPLRYLYVDLDALPTGVKTELGTDGVITFPELPYAIQCRLFFDPTPRDVFQIDQLTGLCLKDADGQCKVAYEMDPKTNLCVKDGNGQCKAKKTKRLGFKGVWMADGEGEAPWLLPNLMTAAERDTIKRVTAAAVSNTDWQKAVTQLYNLARNPNQASFPVSPKNPFKSTADYSFLDKWGIMLGLSPRFDATGTKLSPVPARSITGEKNALTAGMAQGEGYVVIAENNSSEEALKDLPVDLHVIRVVKSPVFKGEIKAIKPKNVFDEKLTLHYTGDFGGEPEKFTFDWYYQPVTGKATLPAPGKLVSPWKPIVAYKKDLTGQLVVNTDPGQTDITIQGASPMTLSDNWVVARYYYKKAWPAPISQASKPTTAATPRADANNWSGWSGENTSDTPMLAMGWIKRVIDDLNPLEARVKDFRYTPTNTTVSMLSQFGSRYEGQIAFSNDPDYLNSLGLIPAYESVLNRGRAFSIDAAPAQNYGPTNDSLLNISSRLATFYLALGNEAYADAVDPTIGFSTKSAEYGNMAPSVFAFQNQVGSLLEEELALMRGRDDSANSTKNPPYYNRLIWNFTQGEGEVAYAQNYNVTDQDRSGLINAADAKAMYPQGHGDAWGHYLQAISYYYKLLGHSNFTWAPRVEFVTVAGDPIMVDYLDERKFATIAAARAKTGAEILDLTYRKLYTDDAAGQWQGYKDTSAQRAWGVDEWARRAGQGAYFDWVTANAILPDSIPATPADYPDRTEWSTDPDTGAWKATPIDGAGIEQIDRSTVPELRDIASQFQAMQSKMAQVDSGVNPLGLVKGVVPFDIDPAMIDMVGYGVPSRTHFEQIYERAEKALDNAYAAYDYANGYTQRLRQNQDTLEEFKKNLTDQERDFRNRLIEIFGYPYADDIGAGKTYPDGYSGPDIFHFNYVDYTELTGKKNQGFQTYKRDYTIMNDLLPYLGGLTNVTTPGGEDGKYTQAVTYNIATDSYWQVKDPSWRSKRRAPGRIQQALSEMIVAEANFNKANIELSNMIGGIEDAKNDLETTHKVLASQLILRNVNEGVSVGLDVAMAHIRGSSLMLKRLSSTTEEVTQTSVEAIAKTINVDGGDVLFGVRATIEGAGSTVSESFAVLGDVADFAEFTTGQVKDRLQSQMELRIEAGNANLAVWQKVQLLNAMIAEVDPKLLETYQLQETLQQAIGNYQAALAEGLRVWDELTAKRKQAAAEVQEYRFQDLGFRVFRNDAIQKYRAQFDLAAKYVYLAATAYDYETNLLGSATGSGRKFLSEIARQRSLGVVSSGMPQAGFPGLADVMARLSQNFAVYKTQLGFNNPQTETTPFSLRTELFRIRADVDSDAAWRDVLKDHKVDDIWKIPEFKRFCRPFAPESAGPQPGIVIKFPTTITYGKNFFGWPLSGGDSAYSSSNFSTKVRSVGFWFENYDNAGLSSTPRVYLVPTGADVLRSPTGDGFATREWQVRDQKLPVPFPIGDSDLKDPSFIPANDSLSDELNGIRRVSDFRAYPYSGEFDPSQVSLDSRLVGRSVWNTQWMLVIPGSTLLFNKDVGLNTFINSVDDLKMFFQTYSYSGN